MPEKKKITEGNEDTEVLEFATFPEIVWISARLQFFE